MELLKVKTHEDREKRKERESFYCRVAADSQSTSCLSSDLFKSDTMHARKRYYTIVERETRMATRKRWERRRKRRRWRMERTKRKKEGEEGTRKKVARRWEGRRKKRGSGGQVDKKEKRIVKICHRIHSCGILRLGDVCVLRQFRFKKNTLKAGGFITGSWRSIQRAGRERRRAYSIGKEELHIEV